MGLDEICYDEDSHIKITSYWSCEICVIGWWTIERVGSVAQVGANRVNV